MYSDATYPAGSTAGLRVFLRGIYRSSETVSLVGVTVPFRTRIWDGSAIDDLKFQD